MGKEEQASHLARLWFHSSEWDIIDLTGENFLIKFLSQAARDEALDSSGNTLPNIPVIVLPWSVHLNSVYTLSQESFWIRIEGLPQYF